MDPLSPSAAADDAWLREQLGARYRGVRQFSAQGFEVRIDRVNGKGRWIYGTSAEFVVAKARTIVEQLRRNAK